MQRAAVTGLAVRTPFGDPHRALMVSERAIGTDQRQKYLLTVGQKNIVKYCPVKVGRLLDGMRVIESGLNPDDLVAIADGTRSESSAPHLAECEPCRAQVNELRAMMAAVLTVGAYVPPLVLGRPQHWPMAVLIVYSIWIVMATTSARCDAVHSYHS